MAYLNVAKTLKLGINKQQTIFKFKATTKFKLNKRTYFQIKHLGQHTMELSNLKAEKLEEKNERVKSENGLSLQRSTCLASLKIQTKLARSQ